MAIRECNAAGIRLVKQYEGEGGFDNANKLFFPYLDPVNIWTIGWGHVIVNDNRILLGAINRTNAATLYPNGLGVAQADGLLQSDLLQTSRNVEMIVANQINDNQFSALVSFAYNVGIGNLRSSTLLKLLNNGQISAAAGQFTRWVRASGVVLPGLVKRREAEQKLFLE